MRPVAATAVGDHHDLFPRVATEGHDWMDIRAKPGRITLGDKLREDLRGAIWARANHPEPHAPGDATPTPIASPRLAFAGLFTFALVLAQRPSQHPIALGFAVPPARAGEGKTPAERFLCVEENDRAATGAILQGRQVE
jgi:hypothetical protein